MARGDTRNGTQGEHCVTQGHAHGPQRGVTLSMGMSTVLPERAHGHERGVIPGHAHRARCGAVRSGRPRRRVSRCHRAGRGAAPCGNSHWLPGLSAGRSDGPAPGLARRGAAGWGRWHRTAPHPTGRTVPCRAVPCRAVPCRAVPCRAVPCRASSSSSSSGVKQDAAAAVAVRRGERSAAGPEAGAPRRGRGESCGSCCGAGAGGSRAPALSGGAGLRGQRYVSGRRAGRAAAHPTGCHIHSRLIPSRRRRGARRAGLGTREGTRVLPQPGGASPRLDDPSVRGPSRPPPVRAPATEPAGSPSGRQLCPHYSASFECGGSSRPSPPDRSPPSPAVPVPSCRWWRRTRARHGGATRPANSAPSLCVPFLASSPASSRSVCALALHTPRVGVRFPCSVSSAGRLPLHPRRPAEPGKRRHGEQLSGPSGTAPRPGGTPGHRFGAQRGQAAVASALQGRDVVSNN